MEYSKSEFNEQTCSVTWRLIPLGVLTIALITFGCGSAEPPAGDSTSSNTRTVQSNGQSSEPSVVNANEVNDANSANSNTLTRGEEMMRRIEKIRADAANQKIDPNAGKITRPGAEDSVITTQLTDRAREIRVFNKHPVLLSVEKVHDGNDGAVYVTLRDGRKITLNGNTVMNIETFTSSQILQIAGVPGSQALQESNPESPTKKRSN